MSYADQRWKLWSYIPPPDLDFLAWFLYSSRMLIVFSLVWLKKKTKEDNVAGSASQMYWYDWCDVSSYYYAKSCYKMVGGKGCLLMDFSTQLIDK